MIAILQIMVKLHAIHIFTFGGYVEVSPSTIFLLTTLPAL